MRFKIYLYMKFVYIILLNYATKLDALQLDFSQHISKIFLKINIKKT